MNILKKLVLVLAALTLSFWLFSAVTSFALAHTVVSPTYIKSWLAEGDLYEKIIPETLRLASLDSPNPDSQKVIEELTPVIQKVITPELLQLTTETVINGIERWLEGSTPKPDFVVQVGPIRQQIISATSDYLYQRTLALPVCTSRQASNNFDPLNATCRPKAVISKNEFNQSAQDFAKDLPFMKYDVLTYETFQTNNNPYWNGQLPSSAPTIYQWLGRLPYIFGLLALLSAAAIILLKKDHMTALKTVGHTLLVAGIFLLISAGITRLLLGHPVGTLGGGSEAQRAFAESIAMPLARSFSLTLSDISLYFGAAFMGLAAVCYMAAIYIKRHRHIDVIQDSPNDLQKS